MENFYEDLSTGRRGERLMKAALLMRGHQVEDLTDIYEYRLKDIDFRLTKNGLTVTLEVKNDIRSNSTGNVFVETYNRNNVKRGGAGWACYCDADYLCFVQEDLHLAHIVEREELIKNCWNGYYKQTNSTFSQGYIVPIERLKQYNTYHCLNLE